MWIRPIYVFEENQEIFGRGREDIGLERTGKAAA